MRPYVSLGRRGHRFDSLREVLDPTLCRVELVDTELVELLAALPQRDRLVERDLSLLEARHDRLELALEFLVRRFLSQLSLRRRPRRPRRGCAHPPPAATRRRLRCRGRSRSR